MGRMRSRSAGRSEASAPARTACVGDRFVDEDGFTTVGVAVALLVTLALLFSAAQLYRIGSLSADVQDVADAAALAAENEVAEFMIAVHVCDALVLSLSVLSLTLSALGVVAACVPPAATLSVKLLDLGKELMDARDGFAERAEAGLSKLQAALPFLAAANAATVGFANDGDGGGSSYLAVAMLVPEKGKDIQVGRAEEERSAQEDVTVGAEDIRQKAQEVEELAQEANEHKMRGFMADCGNAPGRCQYERAASLASLSAEENPLFASVDTWSFAAALERARAYYAARAAQGIPEDGDDETRGDAALRQRFYRYAQEELSRGYVHEGEGSFEASFPLLFRNTAEMRATTMYTESVYPVTMSEDGRHQVMHAWSGCSRAGGSIGTGSVSLLEAQADGFQRCSACEFRPSSLGNVAAASSSIDNGFEHHYRIVAEAAEEHQRVMDELGPKKAELEDQSDSLIDRLLAVIADLGNKRISAEPPGSKGAIALVVNATTTATDEGFESAFAPGGELGARAAVAGATLVADPAHDGSSVITALLDGFGADGGGAAVGAGRIALDGWSWALQAYGEGQRSLLGVIEDGLNGIPLKSLAGLGTRAADRLESGIEACGLEPAKLDALKPVLVNTEAVAGTGTDAFSIRYREIQRKAREVFGESTDLFSGVVDAIQDGAYDELERVAEGVKIAEVELPFLDEPYPVIVKLPQSLLDGARDMVDRCIEGVRSAQASITGRRVWA